MIMTTKITPQQLADMYGCPLARAQIYADPLNDAMEKYEINTDARVATFLAQVGHESGRLQFVREIWGPDKCAWQAKYEGNASLGNTQPGDGFKFRGRGLIQITGRYNYAACGTDLNLPLIDHPELLETPQNAALSAGWFWNLKKLNQYADDDDFETMTRRINGGLNGLDDRQSLLDDIKQAMD